jgi:hypothetical protein
MEMYILLPCQQVIDIATQDGMVDMERILIQPRAAATSVTGPASEMGALIDELTIILGKEKLDEVVV